MNIFNEISYEPYINVLNKIVKIFNNEKEKKIYFLIKENESNKDNGLYLMNKLIFENYALKHLENQLTEEELFNIFFNGNKIKEIKKKKKDEETNLINELKNIDENNITDKKMKDNINILLHFKNENFLKENNFNNFHKYFSFYDDIFSKNIYYIADKIDLVLSEQINGLTILSISEYNEIFLNILNNLKQKESKNLKELINKYVIIKFNEKLNVAKEQKKKKKFINNNMVILEIFFMNNIYKIKSKVQGLLYDVNDIICTKPYLLFKNTQKENWLIIIKKHETDNDKINFISSNDYKNMKNDLIQEYNNTLNYFNET